MRSRNGVTGGYGTNPQSRCLRVAQDLQFVAVKSVTIVGEDVHQDCHGRDREQSERVRART